MRLTRPAPPFVITMPGLRRAWPKVVFFVTAAAAIAYEANVMFSSTSRIRAAGMQPFAIMEFSAGEPVGQTFRALDDALESVDVAFTADQPASVDLVCRLMGWAPYKEPDHWVSLYEWKTTRQVPAGLSWQHFPFKPVPNSTNVVYQFQIQQVDARARGTGNPARPVIALMASTDDSLRDGNVTIGVRQIVDHDLLFEARTANQFTRYRSRANPLLPPMLRSAAVQLAIVGLYNCALAVFAFYLTVADGSERDRHGAAR